MRASGGGAPPASSRCGRRPQLAEQIARAKRRAAEHDRGGHDLLGDLPGCAAGYRTDCPALAVAAVDVPADGSGDEVTKHRKLPEIVRASSAERAGSSVSDRSSPRAAPRDRTLLRRSVRA